MPKVRNRLKELMKEHDITQVELAEATGIPQGTISRWYGNRVDSYNRRLIQVFCEHFKIEPGELIVMETEGV